MIAQLVTDEEALQIPAEPATADDAQVAEDLIDTMKSLEDCACLAANQIGSNKAVIAYDRDGKAIVMFNPRIIAAMRPYMATETCMSLDHDSQVKRFFTIRVAYEELVNGELLQRTKKASDWEAQVIQHSIDHCKGLLV